MAITIDNIGPRLEAYYRHFMDALGTPITYSINLRNGLFDNRGPLAAVIKKYRAEEMVGSITQDHLKCYVIEADLTALGITPVRGDKLVANGRPYNIEQVDYDTRTILLNPIAYVLRIKG